MASKNPNSGQSGRSAQSQLALLFDVKREPAKTSVRAPDVSARLADKRQTWLVHQLVQEAREMVEQEFGDVWVEGEISNCRPASSGHCYFTLKDTEAQLPVVLFRRQAILLRFKIEDGLHVRVRGKVSVYEQRGQLQLVAEAVEPVGAGSLQLAFEQLRDRLKAEGLFDADRKQALPAFPRTVAIVTSPTGAVIRDFLSIVGRRHSALSVILVPVAVQGENAAFEIMSAVSLINEAELADVIVLARGGGSLEDMAAFNSERVARAIASSLLPVVSAVGHETDFTIADFVADLRAPTPSAAAELVTETQHKVEELIAALTNRLIRAARFQILQARQQLGQVAVAYSEQRVVSSLHRLAQRLDELSFKLEAAMSEKLLKLERKTAVLHAAVLRRDPRQQLGLARESLASSESRMLHALESKLHGSGFEFRSIEARLYRAALVSVAARKASYENLRSQMHSLSPLAVLQRGYALVQEEGGKLIRSTEGLTANQKVFTRLSDGDFTSQVLEVREISPNKSKRNKKDKSTNS